MLNYTMILEESTTSVRFFKRGFSNIRSLKAAFAWTEAVTKLN